MGSEEPRATPSVHEEIPGTGAEENVHEELKTHAVTGVEAEIPQPEEPEIAIPEPAPLKPPANPDAVLAFLAGLGLSDADVAALVAKDPQFLCASVERTLAPVVAGLSGLGLSRSDIARLASLSRYSFRYRSIVSKLQYYMPLFGSFENLLRALKKNFYLHSANLDDVVKPNVALLRECGLGACDIAKLCISQPWLLAANPERLQAMVACAENIGVPCGSAMFRHALHAVAFLNEDKIAARVEYLKNTFRWTDAEVAIAVSKAPTVLNRTKEFLQRRSEFLISDLGLEPAYIAHRPLMLAYSLEGRLRPRYYVVTFLKENGLLDHGRDYYYAVKMTEKVAVAGYFKSLSTRDRVSNSVCQQEKTCHTGCTCRIGDIYLEILFESNPPELKVFKLMNLYVAFFLVGEDMLTLVSGAGRLNEAEGWSRFGAHCRRIGNLSLKLLTLSLKGWLRPRYYVVKFLKENGLLGCSRDYYYTVKVTGKESVEKFICPHKEAAPHLTEDYAAAWKGEVPTRFRFA
uniref:mTERF domain-containing protein 1, mitochondrial n=1 Tax=Aegilops tauschii TaxID=37682 RepID=M8B5Z1_AEGTA